MKIIIAAAVTVFALVVIPAKASDIVGPGRFCGYSPIIDLLDGEKVMTWKAGYTEAVSAGKVLSALLKCME